MTTEWLVNQTWANMEQNIQRIQQFQHELGKAAIDFIRKQQDFLTTFQQNYDQLEVESKKFLAKLMETVKANDEEMSETWKEKMVEMEALFEKTNEVTLRFLENSQQKIYEFTTSLLNEQDKFHKEIVQNIESFMRQ